MKISVYNKKGGVGKTSLSFNIAKDLDFYLISNDDSVIEKIYPSKAKIVNKLQIIDKKHNVVYDLGGFLDKGLVDIFKNSDIILIPTTLDINSIQRTINTVLEINSYCKNIIIVINRIKPTTRKKYIQSIEALRGLDKNIFEIRESEALPNSIHSGKTILELSVSSPLAKSVYTNITLDYQILLMELAKDL